MGLEYAIAPIVPEAYAIVTASGTIPPSNANSGVTASLISTGVYQLALPVDMKQPSGSNLIFVTPRTPRAALTTFVIVTQLSESVISVAISRHTGADLVAADTEFEFLMFRSF